MVSKAFAPGNISCIFQIIENRNPLKKHSLGVGFTVDKGVEVSVELSNKEGIVFNDKKIIFPTVSTVKANLLGNKTKVIIKIWSPLKLGCGFGLSGASALATAYAINKEFKLRMSNRKLALIAHHAEVKNGTGLGDVGGQFNGGFMVKFKVGKPLYVEQLHVKERKIYYKVFSGIDTKSVIINDKIKKMINIAGAIALKKILALKKTKKVIPIREIIKISKEFSEKSGLLKNKNVIKLINKIEEIKGNASMIMLGNAVFSDEPFRGCTKLMISQKNAKIIK